MQKRDDVFRYSVVVTKVLFVAALPFLGYGFGEQAVAVANKISLESRKLLAFAAGAILFVPVWGIAIRFFWRPWQFLCTLEHEVTHAVAGLPFLFVPKGMRVTATEGGHVKQVWKGPRFLLPIYGPGSLLSGLAPYFLPTTPYLIIAIDMAAFQSRSYWLGASLGFFAAFHVVSTWAETAYRQPDLKQAGLVFSTLFLPVANLIALGGILAYVAGGPPVFFRFWTGGLLHSYQAIFQTFAGLKTL